MFTTMRIITFREADGAGYLFFARYFALAHDAYEEFMASRGICFREMLEAEQILLPVVHAESDYVAPLRLGDRATIRLEVEEVKRRKFIVRYEFLTPDGSVAARCRTVHVAVDSAKGLAVPLPGALLRALTPGE